MFKDRGYTCNYIRNVIVIMVCACLVIFDNTACFASVNDGSGQIGLTDEELAYLEQHQTLRINVLDGAAPVVYLTEDGQLTGIARSVTDRIGNLLGVEFVCVPSYKPEDVVQVVQNDKADILIIPANYARELVPDVPLTVPYLTAGTVLFYRDGLQPGELDGKRCTVVRGGNIPDGVDEKDVIYCDSRMEALDLVHMNKADYGYGNEFSIAYYAALNDYHNIITLPISSETREYCYGVTKASPLLLSAFNKAIASIDTREMQTIILRASVIPQKPLTFRYIVTQFAVPLTIASITVLLGLLAVVIYVNRTNKSLKLQNIRLTTLSEVSGDLLFEYEVKPDKLLLSRQFRRVFSIPEQDKPYDKTTIAGIIDLDGVLRRGIAGEELSLPHRQYYRAAYSYIQGNEPSPIYLAGKLVDISDEKRRIQTLTEKAKTDGLTNLLNSAESKEKVKTFLAEIKAGQIDALFIIDIDRFKYINDTYGHYYGDKVLIQAASILQSAFDSQDVVGRLGGDEFIVYVCGMASKETAIAKCQVLLEQLGMSLELGGSRETLSVSIGVYLAAAPEPMEDAYQKADKALYWAKETGKGRYALWDPVIHGRRSVPAKHHNTVL